MRHLEVKNWDRFQYYKKRSPPWIRLYNDLLDDYAFAQLPDASKWHAVGLWLLASRFDNKIPADPEWIARRIGAGTAVDVENLVSAGFVRYCQGECGVHASDMQHGAPEGEAETEGEREEETETSLVAAVSSPAPTDGSDDEHASLIEEMKDAARDALKTRPAERRTADGALLKQLFTGDDRTAWQDHRGDQVEWSDRPRLFRLALGHWLSGEREKPRAAVILAIQQQYDPFERVRSSDPIPDTEHARVREKGDEEPGKRRSATSGGLRLVKDDEAEPAPPEQDDAAEVAEWITGNAERWERIKGRILATMPHLAELSQPETAVERVARAKVREILEQERAA